MPCASSIWASSIPAASPAALPRCMINRLRQDGDLEDSISPNFLVRNWGLHRMEHQIRARRFLRLAQIPASAQSRCRERHDRARCLEQAISPMSAKRANGEYQPFLYNTSLNSADVELSEDVFIITREAAEAYKKSKEAPQPAAPPEPLKSRGTATRLPEQAVARLRRPSSKCPLRPAKAHRPASASRN